jgi:hypothetical protein
VYIDLWRTVGRPDMSLCSRLRALRLLFRRPVPPGRCPLRVRVLEARALLRPVLGRARRRRLLLRGPLRAAARLGARDEQVREREEDAEPGEADAEVERGAVAAERVRGCLPAPVHVRLDRARDPEPERDRVVDERVHERGRAGSARECGGARLRGRGRTFPLLEG